jgi:DNA topoisomerase-2
MRTPIVKLSYRNEQLFFYSLYDAQQHIERHPNRSYKTKYYKGLGTSNEKEVLQTFGEEVVIFNYDTEAKHTINKIFNKEFADVRKQWMQNYDEHNVVQYDDTDTNISDYLNYEMIKFSIDDCQRSIPHLMDSFKESQRKVLYACILKGLTHDKDSMKVAQLGGFVAEKTDYHHGENCLHETIIKMAQDFIGSNNIPLLVKDGAFGSRIANGKDAANARYIFTKLSKLTRIIFHPDDDAILEKHEHTDTPIEPKFYVPIIPMVLINGCSGIGTGYSCSIPPHNPLDIVNNIRQWLNDQELTPIHPWYNQFEGTVKQVAANKYETEGIIQNENRNTKKITEIPVGLSIDKFKDKLQDLVDNSKIRKLKNYSTPDHVHFEFKVVNLKEKDLPLVSSISCTNMVLFNQSNHIVKYNSVKSILTEFCTIRLQYYEKRKNHLLTDLKDKHRLIKNKLQFLKDVMEGTLEIHRVDENKVIQEMERRNYRKIDNSYDYLLSLSMRSFTNQKLNQLISQGEELANKIKLLKRKTPKELWLRDLEHFEKEYTK